jgi:hypothetical protein
MKNKLLTTTAISAAMLMGVASANAQTTVKGQVHLTYKALSNENTTGANTGSGSFRGFGKETQLDIATAGKLSNGMNYAAGFALEFDGTDGTAGVATTGTHNENVFIDFISGNTTITIGADHVQNPDFTYTNLVGLRADPENMFAGSSSAATGASSPTASIYPGAGTTRYESYGAGIIQNLGIAKASYYYVPGGSATDENGGGTTFQAAVDTGESGHEFMIRGDFGVKGLDATLFYSVLDNEGQSSQDTVGRMIGAKYNIGKVSVAGEIKRNTGTSQTTTGRGLALGYAVDKDLSVSIGQQLAKIGGVGQQEEKIRFLQVGYSLGPVTTGLSYGKGTNVGGGTGTGAAAVDTNVLYLQLSTAF